MNLWPRFAGKELERQPDRLADKDIRGGEGGLADLNRLKVLYARRRISTIIYGLANMMGTK